MPKAARQPRRCIALADESAAGEASHLGGFFQSNGGQAEVQKDAFGNAPKAKEQEAKFAETRDRAKARMTKEQFDCFASAWKRWDGLPILESTSLPVLEIWGDRGMPAPKRATLRIPERPNIELVWIANAAHHLPTECPKEVADAINVFIVKIEAAKRK